ncbi:MAG: DUF2889 domain-containing protein [Frankia sp.]|nr:DUF2889 domain-containing protein [Frankia sp.]
MTIDVPVELSPTGPVDATPSRRPGSVRRTTSIDMTWNAGFGSTLRLAGRGRDLLTPPAGDPEVLVEQSMDVTVSPERRILGLRLDDRWDDSGRSLDQMVGRRAMSGFRAALADLASEVIDSHEPVALLVDDIPGATLISGFAFSRWAPMVPLLEGARASGALRRMEGICTGFMPGSSGLAPDGTSRWTHRTRAVRLLTDDPDPWAWHRLPPEPAEASMRRIRRIDVWVADGAAQVDAMFQDSATTPDGGRDAVHEYSLTATADAVTGELTSVAPVPRVLPYAECPLAVRQVDRLLGVRLDDLRSVVLDRLSGVAGCTHLNDALRALADVPYLLARLGGGPVGGVPGLTTPGGAVTQDSSSRAVSGETGAVSMPTHPST